MHVKGSIEKDVAYLSHKKKWKCVVSHNPLGEYGHIHHRLTSQIVSIKCSQQNLYYFGKYYKKNQYDAKMKLINDYTSQKKVMRHLNHMMKYENWVKAKDWRSL